VRRMGKKEISRGFEAWADMYFEEQRRKRLLLAAGSKLAKPKLSACYTNWRLDWESHLMAKSKMSMDERLAAEVEAREALRAEMLRARAEGKKKLEEAEKVREELLAKLTALDGGEAQRELEMQRMVEAEREKRVAHLQRMAARRLGHKDMSRGMNAWMDMYFMKTRQQRMLRAAASRLARPKLAAGYTFWRQDWEARQLVLSSKSSVSHEHRVAELLTKNQKLDMELEKVRMDLASARDAMLRGEGNEMEMQRMALEKEAAEKEKRVEHLTQMAVRRLGRRDISRGMNAWIDMFTESRRRQRMLKLCASKLSRPKLVNSYVHWRQSWEMEQVISKKLTAKQQLALERSLRENAETQATRVQVEGESKTAELTVALQEARAASLEHLNQLKESLRQCAFERDAAATARIRADEAIEAERYAKMAQELMEKQQRQMKEEAEARLAKLLADQRRQLELEAAQIRGELETQLAAMRGRLAQKPPAVETAPKQAGLRTVRLIYDPNIPVVDQLREGLKISNTRVMDLFRDMDTDRDGRISKKDFRKAFLEMGPDFPPEVVEQLFDDFDPDKSGEIEFGELDKFLRRSSSPAGAAAGPAGKLGIGGAAAKLASKGKMVKGLANLKGKKGAGAGAEADATDVAGSGKRDFTSNMKIRSDDFFKADGDGNTELDYEEFSKMYVNRQLADGKAEPTEKELKALFQRLDLDASGTVDLSEYVQWALREAIKESKGRVLDLFREWDKDRSGFIDKLEFGNALTTMGFACTKKDLNDIFNDLDPDGTGQLDYGELNASLRRSQRKPPPQPAKGKKK